MAMQASRNGSAESPVETFRLAPAGVEPVAVPGQSLDQVSLHLPCGTYTTLRTYGRDRFLRLDAHLARLDESARLLGHPVRLDFAAIRAGLRGALATVGFPESRVRITVGLSNGSRPDDVYLSVAPFAGPPPEAYTRGVRTLTRLLVRDQPRAKHTEFIAPSRQVKDSLPPGIHEVLMVDDRGEILEGLTSNFFALLDGMLRTAGAGVLEGVARSMALDVAAGLLPVRLKPVRREDVSRLAEAFLTSTSREVVPVVEIDGMPVGTGTPGPVARQILQNYRARVLAEAQPV